MAANISLQSGQSGGNCKKKRHKRQGTRKISLMVHLSEAAGGEEPGCGIYEASISGY